MTGSGTLRRQGSGSLSLSGNLSGFTGDLINEGVGIFQLTGGAALGGTGLLDFTGQFHIDNSSGSHSNRIHDSRALTARGVTLSFTGATGAGGSHETIGQLILEQHTNRIDMTPGSGTSASLTFAGLTRNNRSALLIRAPSLGVNPGANVGNVIFTISPGTLYGGGGDPNTQTNASILPFVPARTDVSSNSDTTFVTWNGVNGRIVPLNVTAGYKSSLTTAGPLDNVNLNTNAVVASGGQQINALRFAPTASEPFPAVLATP